MQLNQAVLYIFIDHWLRLAASASCMKLCLECLKEIISTPQIVYVTILTCSLCCKFWLLICFKEAELVRYLYLTSSMSIDLLIQCTVHYCCCWRINAFRCLVNIPLNISNAASQMLPEFILH